jgi:hypothetical protein
VDTKGEARFGNHHKKKVRFLNKNVLVFAFFLLLSFVFWYLNSLGKNLEADIKYPVSYINIPVNRILTNGPPARLNLYLSGPGYSILRLKISGTKTPVLVDFSKVPYHHLQNSKPGEYYIVASGLVLDFNSQLKSACKVTLVKPDTLFFSMGQSSR